MPVDQWSWSLGFYPGTESHQESAGTAATFDQARIDFDTAWQALLPTLTEADFDRWREARDRTERKYATWEARRKASVADPDHDDDLPLRHSVR